MNLSSFGFVATRILAIWQFSFERFSSRRKKHVHAWGAVSLLPKSIHG
jgi:hypothetical protein